MRVLIVLALGLIAFAAPALAAGDNVVMLAVVHVGMPAKLPGLCQVDGVVRHVWQGNRFQEGDSLSLKVPCGSYDLGGPLPPATLHGFRLTDPVVLRKSALGAAHLDDDGNLMWQPANGDGGRVFWGYRVLDSVSLRLGSTT